MLPITLSRTTHWLLAQYAKPNSNGRNRTSISGETTQCIIYLSRLPLCYIANCDRWIRTTAYTNAWPSQISMVANHILSVGCEDLNLCRKPRKLSSQQQPAKIIAVHCPEWTRTTDLHLQVFFQLSYRATFVVDASFCSSIPGFSFCTSSTIDT